MMRPKVWCCFFALMFFCFSNLFAYEGIHLSTPRFLDKFKQDLYHIWFEGQRDLNFPLNTWHNRYYYSTEHIKRLNEWPLGLGFGNSIWDEKLNYQSLYAQVILDSNFNVEPFVGYLKSYMYHFDERLSAGLGWTFLFTARPDVFHNIPVPFAAPVGVVNFKNFMLTSVYVPGGVNHGNVLFLIMKLTLSQ